MSFNSISLIHLLGIFMHSATPLVSFCPTLLPILQVFIVHTSILLDIYVYIDPVLFYLLSSLLHFSFGAQFFWKAFPLIFGPFWDVFAHQCICLRRLIPASRLIPFCPQVGPLLFITVENACRARLIIPWSCSHLCNYDENRSGYLFVPVLIFVQLI